MKTINLILTAAVVLLFSTPFASATVYYVATNGLDSDPGTTNQPWLTIQYALTNVANGDEIRVGKGTYPENVIITNSSTNLTLNGGYDPAADWARDLANNVTMIAGSGNRVVDVQNKANSNTISGFVITGGGTGIFANLPNDYQLTIDSCSFVSNSSMGVYIVYGKNVTIRNCLIADNTGGGVYVNGIYDAHYFYNCTIANNGGDGIYSANNGRADWPIMKNCIISGNGGYGIRYFGTLDWPPPSYRADIAYSCIYGNGSNAFYGLVHVRNGNIGSDPKFVGGGDYRLQVSSPCIDYGTSAGAPTNDIEGAARPQSGGYDMGCYESAYTGITKSAATYVDATRPDDTGDGQSWATAKKRIQAGLDLTTNGGVCNVAAGVYTGPVMITAATLRGTNWNSTVITSGWDAVCMATNSRIENFTITAGKQHHIQGGTYTGGYGIVNFQNGNAGVENCRIVNGPSYGIYFDFLVGGYSFVIDRCMITSNAWHGIYAYYGYLTVSNSLIARNGNRGVYSLGTAKAQRFYNCTIAGNALSGFENLNTPAANWAVVTNCIISGNGAYGINDYGATYSSSVAYSDIYGNTSGETNGNVNAGAGYIESDPQFLSSANYHLGESSPCRNTGSGNVAGYDLDGLRRTVQGIVDMGCYEWVPPRGTVISIH